MQVAIVVTLKNEEKSIREFIASLLMQTRIPDETIIVDGGSTDRTVSMINEFVIAGKPIRLLVRPGNRSVGRNAGVSASKADVIASTDAGSVIDPVWLEEITRPFESSEPPDVVGGMTLPLADTLFEACVGVINLPEIGDIDPDDFLPSSRSAAFTKQAWLKAGGYPEAFDWNEDTIFDLKLRELGVSFGFTPKAIVQWRPPGTYGQLYRQFKNYARGDGQARIYWREFYWPKKFLIYVAAGLLLYAGSLSGIFFYLLAILSLGYLTRPAGRVVRRTSKIIAVPLLATIIIVRDIAEIAGYIQGSIERFADPKKYAWRDR